MYVLTQANRIYIGDTEGYKSHVVKVGSNQVKLIPEDERLVIKNTHEALVSRGDYQKAKEVVKSNVKSKKNCETSPLTGLLICGCCGNRLSKGKSANKSYLCSNKRYMPDSGCKDVRAVEKHTMDILQRAIATQITLFKEQERELEALFKDGQSEFLVCQREAAKINDKRKRVAEQKLNLYEDYVESRITKEEYLLQKADSAALEKEYIRQQAAIDRKMQDMQGGQDEKIRQHKKASGLLAYEEQALLTREMLAALVERIVVMPDGALEIYWKFMDEMEKVKN